MKGYCKCGKVIDETEFTRFGCCRECNLIELAKLKLLSDFLDEKGKIMKGYCKCGKVIDETEFTRFGCCRKCNLIELAKLKLLSDFLDEKGFNLTAKILKNFISDYIKINWKNII